MRIGIAAPVFANPGVPYFRTPNLIALDWVDLLDSVREAETLGYDSVWVADHLFIGTTGETFENWTVLSALATATSRMRLGTIHLGNLLRHAPLIAKMAATLDVISEGRLDLFLEPAWREREHSAYGYEWIPDPVVRVEQLREAITVMRLLWSGDEVSYAGRHYQLDRALCRPQPVQPGGPPIWLGESFDEASISLIADEATAWNSMPAGETVLADKLARLDDGCRRAGRDPATLRRTLETQVLIYEDVREAEDLFARFEALASKHPAQPAMTDVIEFVKQGNPRLESQTGLDDLRKDFLIGTPNEVAAQLQRIGALGIDEVICWFMDYPERRSMRLLAEAVRPQSVVTSTRI